MMKQTLNVQHPTFNAQFRSASDLNVGRSPRQSPSTAKAGWTLSLGRFLPTEE